MPNLTIKDIARISGCSVSTISRVINDRPDVRPETKEHVLKVMREAGLDFSHVINQSPLKVLDFLESRGHPRIESMREFFEHGA